MCHRLAARGRGRCRHSFLSLLLFATSTVACATAKGPTAGAEPKGAPTASTGAGAAAAQGTPATLTVPLRTLSDTQYPDNPDIGHRSRDYNKIAHGSVTLRRRAPGRYDVVVSAAKGSSRVTLVDIDLMRFMPAIPPHVRADPYLSLVTVVNQEWNRQQVRFARSDTARVRVEGAGYDSQHLARVDLARNCLASGLWEVILFRREGARQVPYFHGWFSFPLPLYAELFRQRNGVPFARYRDVLVKWVDPPSKRIDFAKLRRVVAHFEGKLTSHNDKLYPLTGARVTKRKNIVAPLSFKSIDELLSDKTVFSTFSPPGIYRRADPRKTTLGRLARPRALALRLTSSPADPRPRLEIDLALTDRAGKRRTRLVVGGVDFKRLPRLPLAQHHRGQRMPMGVANHTFYASYADTPKLHADRNPYFGLLVDGNGNFLDSHAVGIDGPLMHRDAKHADRMHLWILSFERHALVGHYVITLPAALVAKL